jgi:dimethylaniline monooxygenase (N-oxide forming)
MDEVATLIGVRPRLWRRPRLLPALLLGPATAAQYRLDGPGSWPGAAEAIRGAWRRSSRSGSAGQPRTGVL